MFSKKITSFINKTLLKWWPDPSWQGAEHCSSLNFGLGFSGPVLGISGSELEAGVEYTFRLTISKDGMAPESTTQTVSAHILLQYAHFTSVVLELGIRTPPRRHKINLRCHKEMINGARTLGFFSNLYLKVWSFNLRAWLIDFRFYNAFLPFLLKKLLLVLSFALLLLRLYTYCFCVLRFFCATTLSQFPNQQNVDQWFNLCLKVGMLLYYLEHPSNHSFIHSHPPRL